MAAIRLLAAVWHGKNGFAFSLSATHKSRSYFNSLKDVRQPVTTRPLSSITPRLYVRHEGSALAAKAPTSNKTANAKQTKKGDGKNEDATSSDSDSSSDDENGSKKEGERLKVTVETSMAYLKSPAYVSSYGDLPVWYHYRRNHKGGIPPRKTRKTCIRHDRLSTGNPCAICRDEYLVLHYKNVPLLKQFISEEDGEVLSYQKTGVCQKQHKALLVAIEQAKDIGALQQKVPLRVYDYTEYYPWLLDDSKGKRDAGTHDNEDALDSQTSVTTGQT